jgi:hypothetical protein
MGVLDWKPRQLIDGLRLMATAGVALIGVGLVGDAATWPTITATLGPTIYVFVAHPETEAARPRNAVIGHAVAIGLGMAALAMFGLWARPSISITGSPSYDQIWASAFAAGATLLVLEVVGSHHAPAAATALLVATGLAKPGRPLLGLVAGLAIVVVLGPVGNRILPSRRPSLDPTQSK